ncbi:MAG: response regulator transcription factor [Nitrospira sp.]|nr:response regulator transcription factor [Nitrospira sp.]
MRHKTQNYRRARQNKKWIVPASSSIISSPSRRIRIFLADGCEIVRAGVRALLEGQRDLNVLGAADNAEDVLSQSRRTKPDVVLLESGLSGRSESEFYKTLRQVLPSVRIISLMMDGDAEAFRNAIEAGAQGFLRKSTGRIELVGAIRTVARGGSYLGSEEADQTFHLLRRQQDTMCARSSLHILSPQERRIIALIAEGNTNKEIAAKLVLSDKTVKNYIGNMFAKLEIERRTQAATLYMKAQQHQHSMCEEISA